MFCRAPWLHISVLFSSFPWRYMMFITSRQLIKSSVKISSNSINIKKLFQLQVYINFFLSKIMNL